MELTPHTLRHTFATRYLEANPGDLRGLAALLGHASMDTVMIYTEPSEEELSERGVRFRVLPFDQNDLPPAIRVREHHRRVCAGEVGPP